MHDELQNSEKHWVEFGAGCLGRGFLNEVAAKLGYTTTLVVAGERTPREVVDAYNRRRGEGGYQVREFTGGAGQEPVSLDNYWFRLRTPARDLVEIIANPKTRVISTSVGISRLPEVVPLLVDGLDGRARTRPAREVGLLILACEN